MAASLWIGYHQFRHTFKQLTGFAPYQYHLQLRIGRAKQLLTETWKAHWDRLLLPGLAWAG